MFFIGLKKLIDMKEFKGTKGKWNIERHQHQLCGDYLIIDENDYQLATADNEYIQDYEKTKANALLISKAPEMLEMLIDLRNCKETWSDLFQSDKDRIELLIKQSTEL